MIWIMYRQLSDDAPALEQANWMMQSLRDASQDGDVTVVDYNNYLTVINNIRQGDVLYFRNIGSALPICNRLTARAVEVGAFVVDKYLRTQYETLGRVSGSRTKIDSQNAMLDADIRTPTTELITLNQFMNGSYTGVIKTVRGGRQGNGTYSYLASDPGRKRAIFEDIISKPRQGEDGLLVQQYIPNRGDIRTVTIGYKPVAFMKRKPKNPESVKFDSSDGTSKAIRNPRSDVVELAERCSRALEISVCSMDIVRSTIDGNLYVVDVNESPTVRILSIRTGVDIPRLIVDYLCLIHENDQWARSTV